MATAEDFDLDYRVTFPSPAANDDSFEDLAAISGQLYRNKEPVVVLLGWVGCQEKHLAKYSQLYERQR